MRLASILITLTVGGCMHSNPEGIARLDTTTAVVRYQASVVTQNRPVMVT